MEDFSTYTLRQLLTLARERLGPAAAALKTRDEVIVALGVSQQSPPVDSKAPVAPEVITKDFFKRR